MTTLVLTVCTIAHAADDFCAVENLNVPTSIVVDVQQSVTIVSKLQITIAHPSNDQMRSYEGGLEADEHYLITIQNPELLPVLTDEDKAVIEDGLIQRYHLNRSSDKFTWNNDELIIDIVLSDDSTIQKISDISNDATLVLDHILHMSAYQERIRRRLASDNSRHRTEEAMLERGDATLTRQQQWESILGDTKARVQELVQQRFTPTSHSLA